MPEEWPAPEKWAPVARVLDANANRAAEGLRVVEDYLRFLRDAASLAAQCKHLRHGLQTLMQVVPDALRCQSRDVTGDVGREVRTPQEYQRATPNDVARANLKRVQQALRSLEEFGKTVCGKWALEVERLRYRAYELEKEVLIRQAPNLHGANLCVLIDQGPSPAEFERRARELIEAQVPMLQLRIKDQSDAVVLDHARRVLQWSSGSATRLIVNDRPDVAAVAGADGVHLGQDDLPLPATRPLLGPHRWIGVSTHSVPQALQAVEEGADYIGVGPTFPSRTKSFEHFPGLDLLQAVASEVRMPAFAIGGIHLENLAAVLDTGIQRVAVASAIWSASSPGTVALEFLRQLPRPPEPLEKPLDEPFAS